MHVQSGVVQTNGHILPNSCFWESYQMAKSMPLPGEMLALCSLMSLHGFREKQTTLLLGVVGLQSC